MTDDLRIASLLASATEILDGLEMADRLVAISHECDHPPRILDRPRVTAPNIDPAGSSRQIDTQVSELSRAAAPLYRIDVETLAALAPDVIITQAHCEVCAVSLDDVMHAVRSDDRLAGADVVALNPNSLDDIFADIRRVADAVGCPQHGEAYAAALRERVASVRRHTDPIPAADRPRTICIEWIDPVMVAANWMPELIALAGGRPGVTQSNRPSTYTDWNTVRAFNPEVVLVTPCGFDLERTLDQIEPRRSLPGWSELSAVRNRRVYAADGNAYFNRSGPRIIDTLEIIAALLHPERVPVRADRTACTRRL